MAGIQWERVGTMASLSQLAWASWPAGGQSLGSAWGWAWPGSGALCPSPFSTPTKPGAPSVWLPIPEPRTVHSTLPGLRTLTDPFSLRLLCLRLPCSPAPLLIPTSDSPPSAQTSPPSPHPWSQCLPVCPDLPPVWPQAQPPTPHLGLSHSASPSLPPSPWPVGPQSAGALCRTGLAAVTPH